MTDDEPWGATDRLVAVRLSGGDAKAAVLSHLRARAAEIDLLVCGARGLGAIQRGLSSLVGRGSVSTALFENAPMSCLIVSNQAIGSFVEKVSTM